MDGNGQIFRNALVHHIERQVAAEDFPLQPQDMDTVAGPDRYGTDLPLLNVEKESLEFRHRLTFGQLSEIAALLRRRARSEEHTSELQSLMRISYAVFCLKNKKTQ